MKRQPLDCSSSDSDCDDIDEEFDLNVLPDHEEEVKENDQLQNDEDMLDEAELK